LNRVQLTAEVVECKPLRYTPAGIPVLELMLAHESEVMEGGRSRRVDMTVSALAIGDLARSLERTALGKRMQIQGFLAATRKGSSRLRLHIQQAVTVAHSATDPAAAAPVSGNETD